MTARKDKTPKKTGLKAVPKTPVWQISPDEAIIGALFLGKVKRYDKKTGSIVLPLEAALSAGDGIRVKGKITDLTQRVERMRVDGQIVHTAAAGESAAIEVADPANPGDAVYKI